MATIQRLVSPRTGAVSYRVQVRVKGGGRHSGTFPNLRDARAWASQTEGQIRDHRYFPTRKASRTTFADIVARYTESEHGKRKTSGGRLMHLAWWKAKFGPQSIVQITPDKIAEATDELAAESFTRGKPQKDKEGNLVLPKQYQRSAATINRYRATLRHLFSVASKEWRLIDRNPVENVKPRRESRNRSRFLTDEERARLLDACANSAWAPLRTLVLLAITTGARRGELINLKWDDVDLKAGRAIVHKTKNGEPKVLPLVGGALEALRAMRLQGGGKSEFVFAQPSGQPGAYLHFDAHWYEALTSAGISDFRFHDLRHTCASYLAAQGFSLLEIADVLGHKSLQMVERYAHLAVDHKAEVLQQLAQARKL